MSPDDASREVIQLAGPALDDAHEFGLGTGWRTDTWDEGGRLLTCSNFIIAA